LIHRQKEDAIIEMESGAWSRLWKPLAGALAVVTIFAIGVNVGNGQISFGRPPHNAENSNLPAKLDYSSVDTVYKALKDNYDGRLSQTQLLDGLKEGLAQATKDPYTEYFNATQANDFKNQLNGTITGIGAQLGKESDGSLEIIAPISATPADKAGLKAKDIITTINKESTSGMSIDTAVEKIRGKKGTSVQLQVVRDKQQSLSFTIVRDDIMVPSVTSRITASNIGYMQISQFSEDTSGLAGQAADKFKAAGVKGVVLDLRSNPGGLLTAAVDVSSLWLPQGKTVLQEKQGNTVIQTYTATGNNVLQDIPTVVLIDGGSASASEITAGALRDNKVASLIGTKSYGKGVVQQIINLSDGSELKVTVASWYRPNGQNINHKGITPDTKLDITDADIKAGNDTQLKAALAQLGGS
jgi:carboxyl-terminal processing protease